MNERHKYAEGVPRSPRQDAIVHLIGVDGRKTISGKAYTRVLVKTPPDRRAWADGYIRVRAVGVI